MQVDFIPTAKIAIALLCASGVLCADDAKKNEPKPIVPAEVKLGRPIDFEKDVYPILEAQCVACHNSAIPESKFNAEDVEGILKGGKRGPSVVPKDLEKSLLYQLASHSRGPVMPPPDNKVDAVPLTPEQVGILKLWILEGATGPSGGSTTPNVQWQPVPADLNAIYATALSPWGRFAAVGRANRITVYDVLTGEETAKLVDANLAGIQYDGKPMYPDGAAHRDFVHSLAFSADGTLLASGGYRVVKLWKRTENVQKLQAALPADVSGMVISTDGKTAALPQADHSIVLVNLADGKPLRTLAGHTAAVMGLAFNADGSRLVTGSHDKSIRVWNTADGALVGRVDSPAPVNDLALTADASQIVTADADNVLRLWATPAGIPAEGASAAPPVREFKGHEKPVTSVAIVIPGALVASGSEDGTVRLWQLADATQTQSMAQGAPVTAVVARPDGQLIASVGANNVVRLWQTADAKQRAEFKGDQRAQRVVVQKTEAQAVARQKLALADAALKAGEKELNERQESLKKANDAKTAADKALTEAQTKEKAAIDAQNAAKAELDKKPEDAELKKKFEEAMKAALAATEAVTSATNGQASAVRGIQASEQAVKNGTDKVAQLKTDLAASDAAQKQADADLAAMQTAATAAEKAIRALEFSADGKKLLTAGDDMLVQLWDGNRGLPLESFTGHATPVLGAGFAGSNTLVSISSDQKLIVWDANPEWTLAGQLGPKADAPLELGPSPFVGRVLALDFSDDGKLLATGGGDPSRSGELFVWDVEKQSLAKEFKDAHSDTVQGVQFSRGGQFLLTGAADKFVKIFDVAAGKHVRSFEGHTHHVLDVSWKGDGSTIASAGADNAIKIWNVETGEQARTIAGYNKQVTAIQFMGVGENTISCSGDGTVRFHKTSDGGNFRNFAGAADYVYSAAASRDETVVIAGGEDGNLRVWNGVTGEVLQTFAPPKPTADAATQASTAPAK